MTEGTTVTDDYDPGIAVEGATDYFMGRPPGANPYDHISALEGFEAWIWGWLTAKSMLETRRDTEVARWLK